MAVEITNNIGPTGANGGGFIAEFPTHLDTYGYGGYRTVANQDERLGISGKLTEQRREIGMAVYQQDTSKLYILTTNPAGSTTQATDWTEFAGGSGPGGSINITGVKTDGSTADIQNATELAMDISNFTVDPGNPTTKAEVTSAYNTNIDPTTSVAINVNDLNNLTAADFVGLSTTDVLNKLLFPTLAPEYEVPTASLADSQTPPTVEVGVQVSNIITLALIKNDSGGWDGVPPTITSSLSGSLAVGNVAETPVTNLDPQFGYTNANIPNKKYTFTATDNFIMPLGNVSYTSSIGYSAGNELKDSTGTDSGPAIGVGSKTPNNIGVTGIYPWFWGLSTSNWTNYATAVAEVVAEIQSPTSTATKEVASSSGNISAAFNGTAGVDFMWFATPATSNDKTVWFENALNNGSIGGTSFSDPNRNLFSDPDTQSITTTLWSGVNYKIYVALKSSDTTTLQLKNS